MTLCDREGSGRCAYAHGQTIFISLSHIFTGLSRLVLVFLSVD